MLDLITLAASMGLQTELNKVRNKDVFEESEQTETPLAPVASEVGSVIESVEEAVVSVASSFIPSAEMICDLLPEPSSSSTMTIDLTLPGASKKE